MPIHQTLMDYCIKKDMDYLTNLKAQIIHMKQRIRAHTFNHRMRELLKEIVVLYKIELKQREEEYLNDYGSHPVYSG